MSNWSALDEATNAIMQDTFGEPVVYQRMVNGQASGEPVTITAVRHMREREEAGVAAHVEAISVNPTDLSFYPQRGDQVTAWGATFTVNTVRQPDPYGLVELVLMA